MSLWDRRSARHVLCNRSKRPPPSGPSHQMTASCDGCNEQFTSAHVHASPEWRSWGMGDHVGHLVDCAWLTENSGVVRGRQPSTPAAHLRNLQQRARLETGLFIN